MLLEVIGIFFESVLFWVLTLLGYALVCVVLTFILYHSGEFSLNYRVFYHMYKSTAQLIEHRYAIQSTFSIFLSQNISQNLSQVLFEVFRHVDHVETCSAHKLSQNLSQILTHN